MPGVLWVRSYYSAEEGKLYREYETPGVDLLFEHARRARIPIDRAEVVLNPATLDVPVAFDPCDPYDAGITPHRRR